MPYEWAEPNYHSIYALLSKRVNEDSVFDVPMAFKSGDVLELVFNNNNRKERLVYGFKYSKSVWVKQEIDVFELAGKYDELHFGKIKK